jgi:hypothetical protein
MPSVRSLVHSNKDGRILDGLRYEKDYFRRLTRMGGAGSTDEGQASEYLFELGPDILWMVGKPGLRIQRSALILRPKEREDRRRDSRVAVRIFRI